MRVLHLALNNLRQSALCDALASLGEYREIDWIKEEREKGRNGLRSDLIRTANEYQPDVIFMQLQNENIIDPDTARQLPGFRINWTGDVRQPIPQWYIDLGKVIDLSLFTNTADVEAMRKAGAVAGYLQIGFDPNIFQKREIEKSGPEIVFMGNNYSGMFPLSELRFKMVLRLQQEFGDRFKVYGDPWPVPAGRVQHNTVEESNIYQRAKIGINLSHFDLGRYSSDRIHSIMGSGCFCLTKDFPGRDKEFWKGVHLDVWNDLDGLVERINYYLEHEQEREALAEAGYRLVHSRDTWQMRIEQLKTMIPCTQE